ncbi:MAG: RtcB family protein [Actinobacteria bacterium]|nr:RtcB family protein [Actinomycetota bacterium]
MATLNEQLEKINDYMYRIPQTYKQGMRVPGIIFVNETLLGLAKKDQAFEQVANVAFLPGIIKASFAMPDIHWGYGFPIGGVAAVDAEEGVISPGGVGFDISCGVRLLRSKLYADEIRDKLEDIMNALSVDIPKGVGIKGKIKLNKDQMTALMKKGVSWAISQGYGWESDAEFTEEKGCFDGADPSRVSEHAYKRGLEQPGTLGAGNHFIELQEVTEIFNEKAAGVFGLHKGQLCIMIHSGSRGVGHQICTDYVKIMDAAIKKYNINLPDRQLACAPLKSKEGKDYYGAMACAANYAWVNRHCLAHWVRESFEKVFKKSAEKLGLTLVYDVSHNIARIEEHIINGQKRRVCVHRKGATRSFGRLQKEIPAAYKESGQPVIIPGDMGRASYVLAGTETAMKESFGSTCHGAGRLMSRSQAKKIIEGSRLKRELEDRGIIVKAGKMSLLAEEAPEAYKDVNEVVEVCQGAGISEKVAKLRPLGALKG